MIPHARFVFVQPGVGQMFNVIDPDSSVYQHESSLSLKTVTLLGLPVVETAEDEEALIRQANAAFIELRGVALRKAA